MQLPSISEGHLILPQLENVPWCGDKGQTWHGDARNRLLITDGNDTEWPIYIPLQTDGKFRKSIQ
jgi:hypothetical protein